VSSPLHPLRCPHGSPPAAIGVAANPPPRPAASAISPLGQGRRRGCAVLPSSPYAAHRSPVFALPLGAGAAHRLLLTRGWWRALATHCKMVYLLIAVYLFPEHNWGLDLCFVGFVCDVDSVRYFLMEFQYMRLSLGV
jgi:hypothetical protein